MLNVQVLNSYDLSPHVSFSLQSNPLSMRNLITNSVTVESSPRVTAPHHNPHYYKAIHYAGPLWLQPVISSNKNISGYWVTDSKQSEENSLSRLFNLFYSGRKDKNILGFCCLSHKLMDLWMHEWQCLGV